MVASAFAVKPLVLEICNPNFCYEQVIPVAKKWEVKHDFTGKKFIRVYAMLVDAIHFYYLGFNAKAL